MLLVHVLCCLNVDGWLARLAKASGVYSVDTCKSTAAQAGPLLLNSCCGVLVTERERGRERVGGRGTMDKRLA